MAGINMLGEELKTTTISKNYFNNIFHSVSDMVFVLDGRGEITDVNNSVHIQLGHNLQSIKGIFIDQLLPVKSRPFFMHLSHKLRGETTHITHKTFLKTASGKQVPVVIAAGNLFNDSKRKIGILLTAKDTTLQTQTENLIIRTIIDTQEKERLRLAKDIHDSLGQQLSAIKFYISTSAELSNDTEQKAILMKSNEALSRAIAEMRSICFNLMPETLEEFGLIEAIKELCTQIQHAKKISFRVIVATEFPKIRKEIEIDLYRVIQEFVNNAMKHGRATSIIIKFRCTSNQIKIALADNGKGFDIHTLTSKGMGLQNIESRTKSHNGVISIKSEPGKGTKLSIAIPFKSVL
jgi:PAS domain S-box-containing protein